MFEKQSNAKNQLLFEDMLGTENETLLNTTVSDIEKQLLERTEILDALVNRIKSASELQNELSSLTPFPMGNLEDMDFSQQ